MQLGAPAKGSPRGGRPRRSAGTSCPRGPRSRRGALLRPRPQQIAAVLQYPRTLAARHWHGPGVGNNCAVPMATRQRLPPPPRPPRTAGPSPRPPPPPPERSGNPGNGGCGSNSDRGQPRPPPPARPPAALGQPGPALWLGRTRALRGRQRRKPPLPLSLARKARAGGSPTQGRSLCSLLNSRRLPSLPGVPRPSSWDGRENLARDPPGPACPDERATQGWNAVPRQESPSEFQIVSAGLHPLTVHWVGGPKFPILPATLRF